MVTFLQEASFQPTTGSCCHLSSPPPSSPPLSPPSCSPLSTLCLLPCLHHNHVYCAPYTLFRNKQTTLHSHSLPVPYILKPFLALPSRQWLSLHSADRKLLSQEVEAMFSSSHNLSSGPLVLNSHAKIPVLRPAHMLTLSATLTCILTYIS